MKRGTLILSAAALGLVLGAAAFGSSLVGERQPPSSPLPQATKLAAAQRTLDDACSSPVTYERLKTRLFDVALDVGDVDPAKLDLLAGSTVVRMEDPILKAKDEELGVTVCAGRFVVELPPGAEKAFDGKRRLEADIEYAAQVAADGSGIVYQLRGAEPITYRLAAFDLKGLPPLTPAEPAATLAQAEPILMAPEPVPAALPTLPSGGAKPVPQVPELVEKAPEPVKIEVAASPKIAKALASSKAKGVDKTANKPVIKKAAIRKELAVKADKPQRGKAAKQAPVKLAAVKPKEPVTRANAVKNAARPVGRPAVKVAKSQAKAAPKPVVKVAKVQPKAVPKPVVKVAKVQPKPAPKPVKAQPKRVVTASKVQPQAVMPKKPAIQRASVSSGNFACGPGRPLSERLMCANPSLGAKERRMMGVYHSALDNADSRTRRVLQETAGDFLAYRNNCRTEACLSGAFEDRVAEIRDIMAGQ